MNTYSYKLYNMLTEAGFLVEKTDNIWTLFSLTGGGREGIMYSTSLGSLIRQAEMELGL